MTSHVPLRNKMEISEHPDLAGDDGEEEDIGMILSGHRSSSLWTLHLPHLPKRVIKGFGKEDVRLLGLSLGTLRMGGRKSGLSPWSLDLLGDWNLPHS